MKALCMLLLLASVTSNLLGACNEPCVAFLVPLEYPPLARAGGMQGTIRVHIKIDKEGQITDAQALPWEKNAYPSLTRKSVENMHVVLGSAAVDNIKQWRFKPSDQGCELTIEYEYRMEGRTSYYHKTNLRFHLPTKVELIDNPPSPNP